MPRSKPKPVVVVTPMEPPILRWDDATIAAEIAELERLLAVLPEENEGQWYTQRVHKEIKSQIETLQTHQLRDKYTGADESDAAFFAMQWLYLSIPGLFDEAQFRADEGPSQEWSTLYPI